MILTLESELSYNRHSNLLRSNFKLSTIRFGGPNPLCLIFSDYSCNASKKRFGETYRPIVGRTWGSFINFGWHLRQNTHVGKTLKGTRITGIYNILSHRHRWTSRNVAKNCKADFKIQNIVCFNQNTTVYSTKVEHKLHGVYRI